MSVGIGAGYPLKRLGGKCRVGKVRMQTYRHSLDGFQVIGIQHIARYLKGVNGIACAETETVVTQRIAFIVVNYSVGKIN